MWGKSQGYSVQLETGRKDFWSTVFEVRNIRSGGAFSTWYFDVLKATGVWRVHLRLYAVAAVFALAAYAANIYNSNLTDSPVLLPFTPLRAAYAGICLMVADLIIIGSSLGYDAGDKKCCTYDRHLL